MKKRFFEFMQNHLYIRRVFAVIFTIGTILIAFLIVAPLELLFIIIPRAIKEYFFSDSSRQAISDYKKVFIAVWKK